MTTRLDETVALTITSGDVIVTNNAQELCHEQESKRWRVWDSVWPILAVHLSATLILELWYQVACTLLVRFVDDEGHAAGATE